MEAKDDKYGGEESKGNDYEFGFSNSLAGNKMGKQTSEQFAPSSLIGKDKKTSHSVMGNGNPAAAKVGEKNSSINQVISDVSISEAEARPGALPRKKFSLVPFAKEKSLKSYSSAQDKSVSSQTAKRPKMMGSIEETPEEAKNERDAPGRKG